MNIGWISGALPYLPCRNGFGAYAGNLILRLARQHRIDLVSLVFAEDENHLEWAQRHCASVQTIPVRRAGVHRRLRNFCYSYLLGRQLQYRRTVEELLHWGSEDRRWDMLHVEGGFAGGLIPPDFPLPKVLSLHDAELLRAIEMLHCQPDPGTKLRCLVRRLYEPRYARLVYPRFDCCVLVAERDATFNRKLVPNAKFAAIPSGVDTDYFQPVLGSRESSVAVFHGNLSYPPNIDAALHLANDVLPLLEHGAPEVMIHLVGASPEARVQALASRPNIKLSANLPDLRKALCSADVYACGVRYGTGLKNKILEAMALGLPIVCYPGSIVGIECIPGEHLLLANDPQEFANHVLSLMRAPEMAQRMAASARQLVKEKYSWDSKASAWDQLYSELIEGSKMRAGASCVTSPAPEAQYS